MVWYGSDGQDGAGRGSFGQRFASDGTRIGSDFQINTYTSSNEGGAAVELGPDGGFVVVWLGLHDGSGYGVFGQRFASDGARLGLEFQVTTQTVDTQRNPMLASDADGDFVVVWNSQGGQDGNLDGIFAQRFSSAGSKVAAEFQVNSHTTGAQVMPDVGLDAAGNFVVAWSSNAQDGPIVATTQYGVFAQRFLSNGAPLDVEFQVNVLTFSDQKNPAIAVTAAGNFVVAYQSQQENNGPYGIFGRRHGPIAPPLAILDLDGDGQAKPLSDGLLFLRYVSGFRDEALVAGAVNLGDCTRCEADDIEASLAFNLGLFDIDDSTAVEAPTDGALVMRYLFELRGVALVDGAVDEADCDRCLANEIEPYLESLLEP